MAKLNYVINTGGEVKIVDYDLNEILTVSNRELHSDQFGYSMIATDLMIDGKITPCLGKYLEKDNNQVFLLSQFWIVNYYIKSSSNKLSKENYSQ